jgi:hypothetical protein
MKLSKPQHQTLTDYVQDKMKPAAICAVCRATNWDISREVFKLTAFQEGSGIAAIPLCVVSCGSCGNTLFIDARRVVGLVLNG